MLINVFERVPGHGEDAALNVGGWAAAVFDGLGGLGSRPVGTQGETEARLASQCARNCLRDLMAAHEEALHEEFARCACEADVLQAAMRLRHQTQSALDDALVSLGQQASADLLPTNCAAVLRLATAAGPYALCLWAGDARVYLLDRAGLAQLSCDDNGTGVDALEDLRGAAPVPQTARLGLDVTRAGGTHLALNVVGVSEASALLTCSDGVYAPYRTPMHFELMLWRWLALEPQAALPLMDDFWQRRAQDDCSLSAVGPSSSAADTWIAAARSRTAELYATYIRDFPAYPTDGSDGDREAYGQIIDELWETYKPSYERFMARA